LLGSERASRTFDAATQETNYDRRDICLGDPRVLRTERGIRLRVREVVAMENALVGMLGVVLIMYLFWTLVRPEDF